MFETIKSCLLTIINNDDKNFDIYRIYFKHLYAITNDHDQRYRRRYQMMIILMIILDLRFIYLMANSNKDIDWHLIHLNIVIVEHVDQTVNIWLATFFAMIIYFIKILYFRNNTMATNLIQSILVHGKSKFFHNNNIDWNDDDDDDDDQSKIPEYYVYRIRKWAIIYRKVFIIFYFFTCK